MKKIISVYINLVIFIISDAFAVKLIAGDRSVIKKDGVTHTISKYYVVPNDFDPNNVTNSNITEATQITKLPLNHSIYSTSLRSGIKNEDQVRGTKSANKHNTNSNTTAASQITKLLFNHSIYSKSMVSRIKNEDQVSGVKLANKHNTNSNTTEASQITKLRLNQSIYSKSLGSGIKNEDQFSGIKLTNKQNKNNKIEVKVCLDQNHVQDKVSNQTCDKIDEATESVTTEHITKPDASINILVEPITYHTNRSTNATADFYKTGNVLHNESRRIVQIATETDFDAELDDLTLTKFGLEVHKNSSKNMDSFWKLVKLNMDNTLGNEEFMEKLDKLTRLLNIFTNLYEAAKLQKPYESMIDGIISILQIPFVEKRNTFESPSDEECLRKCSRNRSKAQVNSKGIEPEGQKPSNNNLEVENLLLQSRLKEDSDNEYALINPNNYQKSNEVIGTELTNSQLLKPYNLGKPDGYSIPSSKTRPKLNHVARDNDNIHGNPKSNQTFPDSTETDNYLDDQPSTTESGVTEPWSIEDKSNESGVTDDQPLTTASRVTKSWITENKPTANILTKPWIIGDKSSESRSYDDQPQTTESRVTEPWIIEDKSTESGVTDDQPLTTASRVTKSWITENKPTANRVTMPRIIKDKSSESRSSDDQPRTTESRVTKPWIIEDKSTESGVTDDQPFTTASRVTKPWINEDKPTANRVTKPWISEDKSSESRSSDDQPLTTESRVTKPWIIEDKPTANRVIKPWISEDKSSESRPSDDQPLTTEFRVTKPWIIEDKPTETRVTKPWIIEDKSTESAATEDQPRTTETSVTKPWIIENKSPKNLPSTITTLRKDNHNLPWDNEDTTTKNLPWHKEYKMTENHPWHIVNKSINRLPWTIKHRTTALPWIIEDRKQLPWIIEDRKQLPWMIEDRKQLPWIIEDRKQLPWIIEDRKQLPWIIEDRKQLPWIIEDRKQLPWIIEDRKQPGIVHRVKNVVKKPYHIYTYVINPTKSEHDIPNSEKIVDVKSRQPNSNHVTKSYSQYTSHGGNKDGYTDSPSYYALQDILPKTTIDSKPSNSQLKHNKYVTTTYDTRTTVKPATHFSENPYDVNQPIYLDGPGVETNNKPTLLQPTNEPGTSQFKLVTPTYDAGNDVNPSDLLHDTPQDDYQSNYALGPGIETNDKSVLLQPSQTHTNSDKDNDEAQVPQKESSQPGFPNDIFKPFQTPQISDKFGPLSTASASVDKSGVNPDLVNTEPKSNIPNLIEPTNMHPASVPKASSYSDYNLPNDYDEPNYGGLTNKQPGLISTASSSTTYTNSPNDHDKLNYIRPANQRPGFISSSALSSAGYPDVGDYYNKPSPIYDVNTPQHPGYISKASFHSEFTTPNNNNNPIADSSENLYQQPGSVPKVAYHPEYTNDYNVPASIYSANTPQLPGYISKASLIIPNDYNNPKAVSSEDIDQQLGYIPMVPYRPEYTNVPDNNNEQIPVNGDHKDQHVTPVYGADLQQHPGYISKATTHSEYANVPNDYNSPTADNSGDINQHPDFMPMVPYYPGNTDIEKKNEKPDPVNVEDINQQPGSVPQVPLYTEYTNVIDHYDKTPIYSGNIPQRPGYKSKISTHSEYTNVPNDYTSPTADNSGDINQHPDFMPMVPYYPRYTDIADNYEKPDPVNVEDINQQPGSVPQVPPYTEYTNVIDHYDKTPIYSGNIPQRPGYKSKISTHSEYTNEPNNYNYPTGVNGEHIHQRPGSGHNVPQYPEHKKVLDDYDKPNPIYSANTPQPPGYISKASLIIPNDNNPTSDSSENIDQQPNSVAKFPQYSEYKNVIDHYDKAPIYSENTPQLPSDISKISAHSEYIYVPNGYTDVDKDTDRPSLTQNVPQYPVADSLNYNVDPTLVNNGPTENKDIFPLGYNPHGQHATQSSPIENLLVSESTEANLIEQFKLKMAPTYRLFTIDNLLKLHDAVTKVIEISGADVSGSRALINLRKIIKIILIFAKQLEIPEGSNEWYIKIFYNAQIHRHPLQLYVYNLLRQRWLHELMLLLDKNNFDIQILQNPKIFSFLGSWQFPDYVQNFLKAENLIHHDFDAPVDYAATLTSQKHKFSTHTYDNLVEIPKELTSYVTDKVMQNYEAPNDGIVLSIAGVKAEPDANAIINILQKYLHYKSEIENQENVIIRDNKVEMLKQIILFLKQKGYNAGTISNLIHKLYSAIYLSEKKDCQPHHPKFEKNIFNVILPVLRRSGR